jgi:hypothetical protein
VSYAKWAKWKATDLNGSTHVFEFRPFAVLTEGYPMEQWNTTGRKQLVGKGRTCVNWAETLRQLEMKEWAE